MPPYEPEADRSKTMRDQIWAQSSSKTLRAAIHCRQAMRASPRGIPHLRLLRLCIKRSLPILHDLHSIFPKRLKCCVDRLKSPDKDAIGTIKEPLSIFSTNPSLLRMLRCLLGRCLIGPRNVFKPRFNRLNTQPNRAIPCQREHNVSCPVLARLKGGG
jgi:hypothetical protein